ncbi:hypothetical protein ACTOV4_24045 [Brucella sp. C7-11G]
MVSGNALMTVVARARKGGKKAGGGVTAGLAEAHYHFGQRSQFILCRFELFEEVGAEGFVGRGYAAGGIVRRDAR